MRLIMIGTSHGVPEAHRRCSSYLLEVNGSYYIVDMGPGGGTEGGRIVACGTPEEIRKCAESLTGQNL